MMSKSSCGRAWTRVGRESEVAGVWMVLPVLVFGVAMLGVVV